MEKILKINIFDFTYKIFSLGHRNPQGLTVINKKIFFHPNMDHMVVMK